MLDGLDAIDWAGLEHNLGTAEGIPALLRGYARGEEPEDASDDLDSLLVRHDGRMCSAAPAALPFVLELAEAPQAEHRAWYVDIVASLARDATGAGDGWADAWEAAVPRLSALAADADPAVRKAARRALKVSHHDMPPPMIDADRRMEVVRDIARRLSERRDLDAQLLPDLSELATDPDTSVRASAVFVLACVATVAYAEDLASMFVDESLAEAAIWGLARLGDVRGVRALAARVTDDRWSGGYARLHHPAEPFVFVLPSLGEVLEQLPESRVPVVLPAVRERCETTPRLAVRQDFRHTLDYWGESADDVPATPDPVLLADPDPWIRTRAAYAHWRATGDRGEPVRVLTAVVRTALDGPLALPVGRAAIGSLARMRAPEAMSLARRILDGNRRLRYFGGWRAFAEDEDWCRAARTILDG